MNTVGEWMCYFTIVWPRSIPWEAPSPTGTYCEVGWMGPKFGLDDME
jgi:hypothetical protein